MSLTAREIQYLRLMADGHTRESAAHAMGITIGGANSFARSVLTKLSAASMTQAVHLADREQLLDEPPADPEPPVPCTCPGDRAAYRRHIRRGETACPASRRANAQYVREIRRAA
ncbi:LuxR C-terminal-related transcriptional regulator [Kitasatospora sp. NPDC057692]|uniref:LuxR C-terminal-related transcriptional regulator n=1 Tax=Kitasatospora sp. NPDC057692 TaxID=3346215 RepID=UPI0036ABAEC2